IATSIVPMIARLPSGDKKPRASRRPPPSSDRAASQAQGMAGRIRSLTTEEVQALMPGPPHHPKTFWAPCPAIVRPTTTRRIKSPRLRDVIFLRYPRGAVYIPSPDRLSESESRTQRGPVAQLVRAADS